MKQETTNRIGSDAGTIEILRDLYFAAKDEGDVTGVDLATLTYLLLRKAHDHELIESKGEIAAKLGVGIDTVIRSVERLDKSKHVKVRKQSRSGAIKRPDALHVNLERIPARVQRSAPSADAVHLAAAYIDWLDAEVKLKKFQRARAFKPMQELAAQRLIDRYNGREEAGAFIFWVVEQERFAKTVSHSLTRVAESKAIRAAYKASNTQQ